MKFLLCLLFLVFSGLAFGQVQQDIVLKSRFDLESSQAFINQVRIFLDNNNFGDPYAQELKKPIEIDLGKAINEMPRDTQKWITELQSVLQIKLFESQYNLVIEKLSYSIEDFNSEFLPGKSTAQRVEYVTVSYVKGLHLRADKISFEVVLQQTQTRGPITFKIELIEPEFVVSQELMAEISMGWATSILKDNIQLTLEQVDIRKIMEKIVKSPELIDLKIKDMVMPQVSIRIGHKEITFDQKKIKNFFLVRKEEMKKGILDLLNVKMSERFSNIIKDNPKKILLDRIYGIQTIINGVWDIQQMTVNKTGIVQFDLDGHFCETAETLVEDFCGDRKLPAKLRRQIGLSAYQKSLREMNRSLIEKKTNVALSVSEHYLNQLIEATIKAGLWEDALKGKEFTLGPEKSFVLADEKGDFSLYLDIIYKLKGAQRIMVGRSELRFPIKFMIALNVEDIDDIPHLTIKVKKVATDHKLLLEGLESYGLPTTVDSVPRFRGKVLKAIMEDVSSFEGQTLIDFEMKELKGTYLDQLEFFSDGLGRGTATIGFKKSGSL